MFYEQDRLPWSVICPGRRKDASHTMHARYISSWYRQQRRNWIFNFLQLIPSFCPVFSSNHMFVIGKSAQREREKLAKISAKNSIVLHNLHDRLITPSLLHLPWEERHCNLAQTLVIDKMIYCYRNGQTKMWSVQSNIGPKRWKDMPGN